MGRGGYRIGAGRPGHKFKAEHCRRLAISDLTRCKVLGTTGYIGWQWTDRATGEQKSAIGINVMADRLTLLYAVDGQRVEQHVDLDRTACNFGGSRPWLLCPCCGRRVGVLYLRAARFKCRHCARLAYSSQSEDDLGRTWRLQRKLEARLGPNWERPKGMHATTRAKLLEGIFACEEARDRALADAMVRLKMIDRWLSDSSRQVRS